jgi:hypothetical protein
VAGQPLGATFVGAVLKHLDPGLADLLPAVLNKRVQSLLNRGITESLCKFVT